MKLTQTTLNEHAQRKPNAKVPNANYIPLAHVGSIEACVGSVEARVQSTEARVGSLGGCVGSPGVHVGSVRVFRYQHIGIPNAKCSR